MSPELREVLARWMKVHNRDLLFAAGLSRLNRRNALRDLKLLGKKVQIPAEQIGWHRLRHTFGTNYVDEDGDIFSLQRIMGHSQISTTRRYVHQETKDLRKKHSKFSTLLRRR